MSRFRGRPGAGAHDDRVTRPDDRFECDVLDFFLVPDNPDASRRSTVAQAARKRKHLQDGRAALDPHRAGAADLAADVDGLGPLDDHQVAIL
jgi:hypothetical protein